MHSDQVSILSHVCKTPALISAGGSRGLLSPKFFATGKGSMKNILLHTDASQSLFRWRIWSRSFCEEKEKVSIDLQQLISCLQLIFTLWAGNVKYSLPRTLSGSFFEWLNLQKGSDNLLSVHPPCCSVTSFSPVCSWFLLLARYPIFYTYLLFCCQPNHCCLIIQQNRTLHIPREGTKKTLSIQEH